MATISRLFPGRYQALIRQDRAGSTAAAPAGARPPTGLALSHIAEASVTARALPVEGGTTAVIPISPADRILAGSASLLWAVSEGRPLHGPIQIIRSSNAATFYCRPITPVPGGNRGKTFDVLEYVLVGSRAWDVALTADEKTAYVANGLSDDITVIDMTTMTPVQSLPVGRTPHSIRVDD